MNVYGYSSALSILNIDCSRAPGAGARLQSPLAAVGHSLVSDNSEVAVFTSSAPGKFSITATVSISAKLGEAGQHQLDRNRSLSVTTVVTVTERLQITNLAEEARAAALLLAPGSSYQLRSNKNSVFSSEDTSVAAVSRAGRVTAGGSAGSVTVRARHGAEEVAVVVEVRPVHYILLTAEAEPADSWRGAALDSVPRGGQLRLGVTRHDKWGRVFSGDQESVRTRRSRFDLIKSAGAGSSLETAARGWTVVRAWHQDKEAWLVARVGEGIMGAGSLQLGDVADFDSLVTGEGHWEADPAEVLAVAPDTGVVVAAAPGHARLRYLTQAGASVFSRQVSVARADRVAIDSSQVLGGGRDTVEVAVLLAGAANRDTNLVSGRPVPSPPAVKLFSCDLSWDLDTDIGLVMAASPAWSQGSHWACVVTMLGPGPAHPAQLTLTVLGTAATLRYLPPIDVAARSVQVGAGGGAITVTGHSAVLDLLATSHSEGVELGAAWLEAEGELHLPVHLTAPHYAASPSVTVSVPATGQSVTVTVVPLISSCRNNTGFLTAVVGELVTYYQTVICIVLVSVLTAYVTRTQLSKTAPPAPAPAPAPAPSSPSRGGETADSTQNATSPYLWTQDNSPIYGSPIYR